MTKCGGKQLNLLLLAFVLYQPDLHCTPDVEDHGNFFASNLLWEMALKDLDWIQLTL